MTEQEYKQAKQVLANAPDGATHFDGTYYRYEGYEYGQAYLVLKNGSWARGTPSYPYLYVSALADIRTIIEQAERIAELEIKSLELTALCCLICDLNECEQESEDFENIASELIDRALTVLGRTDT